MHDDDTAHVDIGSSLDSQEGDRSPTECPCNELDRQENRNQGEPLPKGDALKPLCRRHSRDDESENYNQEQCVCGVEGEAISKKLLDRKVLVYVGCVIAPRL